jgi:hypothetical protein
MAEHDQPQDDREPQAPRNFVEALKALDRERIFVPPNVDEAVLSRARRHLSQAKRRSTIRPLAPWVALAASIAMGAWLILTLPRFKSDSGPGELAGRKESVPRIQVDIFDAFSLARLLERGQKVDLRFDFNGDGVVDRRDVEAMARQAVRLEKGGRS